MASKKANLPVGRPRSQTRGQLMPGLIWAFRFYADGSSEELAVDQGISDHADGWLWLHFDLPAGPAPQVLSSFFHLSAAALEMLVSRDERQELHVDETCIYGIFANLVGGRTKRIDQIDFVHFAMTERVLVSNRGHSMDALGAVRRTLREGRKITTAVTLLVSIVEHVIDAVDDYAEDIAGSLDDIEERILGGAGRDERRRLADIRRTAVRLHRQLAMSRSLIKRFECDLARPAIPFGVPTDKLAQRLDWLDTEVVASRDRAHLLQEEVTLKLAEQTNRHLEVLSIVATVFLPASLVAGIFGMNVKGLPLTANGYGFLWSMGILIGASAIVFWLLKRMGAVGR
jgi:zinc transporter